MMAGFLYAVNNGKLNGALQHGIQFVLSLNGIETRLEKFKFKNGTLSSDRVSLELGAGLAIIDNLKIDIDIQEAFSQPSLLVEIAPATMTIWNSADQQIAQFDLSGQFIQNKLDRSDYNLYFNNIEVFDLANTGREELSVGKARFGYKFIDNQEFFYGFVNFGDSTHFKIENQKDDLSKVKIDLKDIPIMLYKKVMQIFPDNEILVFLEEFVRNGYLQEGNIIWKTEADSIEEQLSGFVKIRNLDFEYNIDFPTVKDLSFDIDIKGRKIIYNINSGYSSDILLSGGAIIMDWKGVDKTVLTLKTKGHGPATGLVDFIAEEQHQSMNKANIDLKKLVGDVDVDVDIEIPLKPGTANKYNVTATLPDLSLDIFKDNILLRSANISGGYDGSKVILQGVGEINGYDSDLNFTYNIEDESEFGHKLDIKTRFKTHLSSDKDTKIGFVTLLGGESIVDLQYTNKNSKGLIVVNSDVSNLDLYFDKLGIKKDKNAPANIEIKGAFDTPTSGVFKFAATGEDLNINGDITINNNLIEADIKQIFAKETNLSALLFIKDDRVIAEIKGKELDLSQADMLQFLEKERDSGSTKLILDVDKVRLKDDIWLDDLKIKLECDKDRCFSGHINSRLGSRFVEMSLFAQGDQEKWIIKCGNAGAILQGIGAYKSMKAGDLTIQVNTSRKEVQSGQIIPILDGTFMFERFVLRDTPVMGQIISYASVPGLVNILRGEKDIIFSSMNGQFSFADDVLTIKEGIAIGPYFDFNLKGYIDTEKKFMNLEGFVTPNLYGISSVVGMIPIIGNIFSGTKSHRGLISGSYKIKEKY
ncbi:MAG: DUF3971 domain-containing protein [Rickettsiaceae bacterium]|nr:DUF3971 domain-containing protein [Rickettsiaceae bacterium]